MENRFGLRMIGLKDLKVVLILLAITLPISFWAAHLPEMKDYYLLYPLTAEGTAYRFASMFFLELFFRGFVMFGILGRFGKNSIILQDIPYVLIHLGKPLLELPYSGVAGLVFGKINYKSKSFLPSFLLHSIGSEIFIVMVHLL
jgi:uncharacterized protein